MKIIIVSKSFEKVETFFTKQGSFEVVQAMDSIASNMDKLSSNILHIDKFIIIATDTMDFALEIRSLLTLLNSPSGLLRINELVFFFREDMNSFRLKEYISVVADHVKNKSQQDQTWFAPHVVVNELKTLSFDVIYKELLGKSTVTAIDPKSVLKYREERGETSQKAFEASDEVISISPFDNENLRNYSAIKEMLKKTENPANLSAMEVLIPEYEDLKLAEYKNLGYFDRKWILVSGDRMSGSTTHTTAMAVSAAKAGKSVLIIDFTANGDICEYLKIAATPYRELSAVEMLNNSVVMVEESICTYSNRDREVLRTLLPYMQSRPNVFDRDVVLISFDLTDIKSVLGAVNTQYCSLVLSSLLFSTSIEKLLALDVGNLKTLVWLNDNINSSLRKNKLTLDIIKVRSRESGHSFKFMEPIFFEDFELEPSFFNAIADAL